MTCLACSVVYEYGNGMTWYNGDRSGNVPKAPQDLSGSSVCSECYYKPGLEQAIRNNLAKIRGIHVTATMKAANQIQMPDGSVGLICVSCKNYYPWAETKEPEFTCRSCRV